MTVCLQEAYEPCPGETMVEELADCHELACLQHPGHRKGHVISSRFAMILPELFYPTGMSPPKAFVHIPDCADSAIAPPLPWAEKTANVTQIGKSWVQLYPMRPKMAAAIAQGLIPGVRRAASSVPCCQQYFQLGCMMLGLHTGAQELIPGVRSILPGKLLVCFVLLQAVISAELHGALSAEQCICT